ncbi:ROK family transcriptional regulator [Agromyces neolithicus]|uniref:ROK family transcriptional regulator n=1 Tax=Agromyces neolithicus TaxID=269420 RepID=A0ABN2M631_9MICO
MHPLMARADLRHQNLRRALQIVVRDGGEATRAKIARETGLTSATVSSLIAELEQSGFVDEGGQASSTGGKRATLLRAAERGHEIIAVGVRPHRISGGVFNLAGEKLAEARAEFESGVRADDVVDFVERLANDHCERLLAVGIQVPGAAESRVVVESVQLGWFELDLGGLVEKAVGAPTHVINDAHAEALGELIDDREREGVHLFVHLGEGIGAAVVHRGELLRGASARGGEIGHVRVVFEGERAQCRCGLYGCLESAASMSAMIGDEFRDELTAVEVAQLVGGPYIRARLAAGASAFARALRLLSAMLDPDDVVIGGAAPSLGPDFLNMLQDELDLYRAKGAGPVAVRYARPTDPFLGAAQHALMSTLGVRWNRPGVALAG